MKAAIARRFSGLQPSSLPPDVLFVSAEPSPLAGEVRNCWVTIEDARLAAASIGDGGDRADPARAHPLGKAAAIIAVFDAFDKAAFERTQGALEELLAKTEAPPPVIVLPIRPEGATNEARRLFEVLGPQDFASSCLDDLILGEPSGFELALAIHTAVAKAQIRSLSGDDELRRRDVADEGAHMLRSSVACAMWQYLPQRLHLDLPPIDHDLGDSRARQVAGYAIQERLAFGADEFIFRVEPPVGVASVPAGEMVKIVPKSLLPASIDALRRLDRFLTISDALSNRWQHPNLARSLQIYHSETCMYVRMELAGTESLFQRLKACASGGKSLSQFKVRSIVVQLARAVCHLHTGPRICHRDLKPENVAIAEAEDGAITAKLVNFDTAAVQPVGSMSKLRSGTFPFVAPEMSEGKYDGMAADMWSFGVILCELSCGAGSIERKLQLNVQPSNRTFPKKAVGEVRDFLSDGLRIHDFLVESSWPDLEPTVPWFEVAIQYLNNVRPSLRWSAAQLKGAAEDFLGQGGEEAR